MIKDKHLMYGLTAVAGVGIAVWSGVPAYYLLLLACPVIMFFMMASMSGDKDRSDAESHRGGPAARTRTPTGGAPTTASTTPSLITHVPEGGKVLWA